MDNIFRTQPLAAPELTAPPESLLSLVDSQGTRYIHGRETIDPVDHNLAAFPYHAKGECFFSSIAKAVYGDEQFHPNVCAAVCDYIDTFIRNDDFEKKLGDRDIIGYFLVARDDMVWTNASFDLAMTSYLSHMRQPFTPATDLEFGIACYMFRLRILLLARIDKFYPKKIIVSTINAATIKGSGCVGVDANWIAKNPAAKPGVCTDISTIVMLYSTYETYDAAGNRKAEAKSDCGHYELMYDRSKVVAAPQLPVPIPVHMPVQWHAASAAESRRQNALGRGVVGMQSAGVSSVLARGICADALPFKNTCAASGPVTRVPTITDIQMMQDEIRTLHTEIEIRVAAKDTRLRDVIAKINQHQNELALHQAHWGHLIQTQPVDLVKMEACGKSVENSKIKVQQYETCKIKDALHLDSLQQRLAHLSQLYGAQSEGAGFVQSPVRENAPTSKHSPSSLITTINGMQIQNTSTQNDMQIDHIGPVESTPPKTVGAPVLAKNRTSKVTLPMISMHVTDDRCEDSELRALHVEIAALKLVLKGYIHTMAQLLRTRDVKIFDKAYSTALRECLERVTKQENIIAQKEKAAAARRAIVCP